MSSEPLELEPDPDPKNTFAPRPDRRPRMPEPQPVKLVSVDDVQLLALEGSEAALDAFYVGILKFEKLDAESMEPQPAYRAENFLLRFELGEPPVLERDGMRFQGIEVGSLADTELQLIEAEIEYERQRSLQPGRETLVLRDPAGNWIELHESREVG